ncbi:HD-GYP domain-containing protein [Alteromonas halophila]|uniref:Phosphodiesterase n=1 Tax=Alteromonas halophila TaxID=516698 RepID=A0A918JQR6_9ALTE|nr:HD-GYP domain-containing protein [Alteromonas halophila]GGW96600.1 phosphodiesterase [Alteromonas halophila]
MTESSLRTIKIKDLKPGMYVHEILDHSGKLKVKSRGRVSSDAIVAKLKARGVKEVVIDEARQDDDVPKDSTVAVTVAPEKESEDPGSANVTIEDELARARKLHAKGKNIQKQLLKSVKKGLPFDNAIPRDFSHSLVESIDRNPNALVCLTKIREKDDYLLEHSLNVAILLANFGRHLGMSTKEVEDLAYAGFLHDIGKIQIPDEILHKPGRLTDAEMTVMKEHVQRGVDVLVETGISEELIRTVSEHHERLDGLGYPAGVSGDDISHTGRMLAIADVYDALTADRVYKAGMPSQKAFSILMADSPHKLDKDLVQQFIKCMGVYPIGSLVLLSNERLAMVMEQTDAPLAPKVKIFYSVRNQHFLEPKDCDLSAEASLKVVKAALGSDYRIDVNGFFERAVAPQ